MCSVPYAMRLKKKWFDYFGIIRFERPDKDFYGNGIGPSIGATSYAGRLLRSARNGGWS